MPRLKSSLDVAHGKRASSSNSDDSWANSREESTRPQQGLKAAPPGGPTSSAPNGSDAALKAPDIPQKLGILSNSHSGSNSTTQALTVSLDSAKCTRLTESRPKFNWMTKSTNEKRSTVSRSEDPSASNKPTSPDTTVGEARSGYVGRLALSSDAPERLVDDAAVHVTASIKSSGQADQSIGLLRGRNALPVGERERNPPINRCRQLCVSSAPASVTSGGVAVPFSVQSSGREPLTSSACPALTAELLPSAETGSFARILSSLPRVDRRAASSVLTYQLTFLVLLVGSSVVLLRSSPRKRHRYAALNGSECDALAVLSGFVNATADPCGSFYHYTCGSASRGSHSAWSAHNMLKPWWASTGSLYWPSGTKAGKFLRDYFQACVDTSMEVDTRGAKAARALVEIVKPRATMTWSRFLLLLMNMNLKYGVKAVVVFSMLGSGPWPDAIIPVTPKVRAEDPLAVLLNPVHHGVGAEVADVYDRIRRDALSTLNQALSLNVTGGDVERLVADLDSAAAEPPLGGVGDLGVLATAVPAMKPYRWRLYIEDIVERPFTGRVYHAPMPALKHRFSILLDKARLPQTIVFALLEATTDLLLDIIHELSAKEVHRYFIVCQKLTLRLEAVAVLSAIQDQPRSLQHDSALLSVFESVTKAVVSQVSKSFPTTADVSKAASRLRELRLLMPSEVVPLDTPLPTLSASYARNYLLAETHDLSVDRFQPAKEDLNASAVTALLGRKPSVIGVCVILPVTLYAALNLTSYADAVVPMSVVGVDLADALWSFVFQGSWSRDTMSMLSENARCRDAQWGLSRLRFRHPVLSLRSVLNASINSLWNHKFSVDKLRFETSRSEVFYTLFVMHHYCLSSRKTRAILAAEVDYLTGVSVDFAKAFGCLLPDNAAVCPLPGLQ